MRLREVCQILWLYPVLQERLSRVETDRINAGERRHREPADPQYANLYSQMPSSTFNSIQSAKQNVLFPDWRRLIKASMHGCDQPRHICEGNADHYSDASRVNHFIPVVAMPVVIKRCKKANTSVIGNKVTTVIAST